MGFSNQISSASPGSPSGGGKSAASGQALTTPATSQQQSFGQPNANATPYSNTVGQWDNAQIGTQATGQSSGKGGKGQSNGWQPSSVVQDLSSQQTTASPITQPVSAPADVQGPMTFMNHH